jgi:hypothetical protein
MDKHLEMLIERSRKTPMNESEKERQRRSFAYGNTHFENPLITREMVDREADRMKRQQATSSAAEQK